MVRMSDVGLIRRSNKASNFWRETIREGHETFHRDWHSFLFVSLSITLTVFRSRVSAVLSTSTNKQSVGSFIRECGQIGKALCACVFLYVVKYNMLCAALIGVTLVMAVALKPCCFCMLPQNSNSLAIYLLINRGLTWDLHSHRYDLFFWEGHAWHDYSFPTLLYLRSNCCKMTSIAEVGRGLGMTHKYPGFVQARDNTTDRKHEAMLGDKSLTRNDREATLTEIKGHMCVQLNLHRYHYYMLQLALFYLLVIFFYFYLFCFVGHASDAEWIILFIIIDSSMPRFN